MKRSAAALAAEAADFLMAWLRTQPRVPVPAAPDPAPSGALEAEASPGASTTGPNRQVMAPSPPSREGAVRGAPLRLPHTDWLHHHLTVSGPADPLGTFRAAAAGAGVIPWQFDLDRIEADMFHLLVAPPPPQHRTLSVTGARVLARQLRDLAGRRADLAAAQVGTSRACPFDLHALVPVPYGILVLGPDDPASEAWLWEQWGTTEPLRRVRLLPDRPAAGEAVIGLEFWSADWSPWRAIAQCAERWPALRFDLRPSYDT